jgi:hypothetical protein
MLALLTRMLASHLAMARMFLLSFAMHLHLVAKEARGRRELLLELPAERHGERARASGDGLERGRRTEVRG